MQHILFPSALEPLQIWRSPDDDIKSDYEDRHPFLFRQLIANVHQELANRQ